MSPAREIQMRIDMSIKDWPLNERPREKILKHGAGALSEAELLAIFLTSGTKGYTAIDLARNLLQEFKSLHHLLNLPLSQLTEIKGIGKAKYAILQAVLEMGKRYLEEDLRHNLSFTSAHCAQLFLRTKLSGYHHEVFACVFLNSAHQMLGYEELFAGTLNCTPIYPRVIAQKALEYNAGALIVAHNHPSGNVKPSQNDIDTTLEMAKILSILDITVLDHIIVGANGCSSMAELGLLSY